MDRSSEAGAADEGLDQHHRGASRACSKLVFFVVAFLLKSVSKGNDAWQYATSMPEDVAVATLDVQRIIVMFSDPLAAGSTSTVGRRI